MIQVRILATITAFLLGAVSMAAPLPAQPQVVPASAPAEPDALPLYGDRTPGSAASEVWGKYGGQVYGVRNVSRPTLTPFLPDPAKATGAAVIVAPGGAFMGLAIEHEGWQVARALAERGIAAFVLKYRVIPTPTEEAAASKYMGERVRNEISGEGPMAGALLRESKAPEDALAALSMVRANASKWKIDPARVGIIGFSAGAMTSRRVALDADPAVRPAFVGYVYGPQDAEPVPADAPPLFDAIALDDGLFPSKGFPIVGAWLAAKRPVEIHGYQKGNHGFGLGIPGTTTTLLIDEFTAWLAMQGFLGVSTVK
jgi:acetyl esterase/lipase